MDKEYPESTDDDPDDDLGNDSPGGMVVSWDLLVVACLSTA